MDMINSMPPYPTPSKMDPQCHPQRSQAQSEADLQAEQDEFFLSGSANCVKVISANPSESSNRFPSVPVLDEVMERPSTSIKPPQPPSAKAPLKPTKITANPKSSVLNEESLGFDELKDKISHENDEKLAKMSAEEIEALKSELYESVPESFLEKLRNKQV